jgi:para-aminobenzoate synthetase component I
LTEFQRPEEIKAKINDFAREKAPFLFIIDSSLAKGIVVSPYEALKQGIFFNFNGQTNWYGNTENLPPMQFDFFPVSFEIYEKAFNKISFHLHRGDSYLVNLTFPTPVRTNFTLRQIFQVSRASYKLLFRDQFLVFSPEIFIRIKDGLISSFPMKGTINAGIPGADQIIRDDGKELCEHHTIVDLIRNDLAMVSTGVKVNRFRYIDRLRTNRSDLLQVSSEISGLLPPNFLSELGEIIFTLLPAGSVTGAPKEKTVQIINEAEICERGFYTGICGYFDGNSLDSAVMIRFIEKKINGLVFRSGGGITIQSDAGKEYQEMIDKVYVPVF